MPESRKKLYTIALRLAQVTIIYNVVEGILATVLGFEDKTLALFGFGLDSFIEMISGIGVLYMIVRIQKTNVEEEKKHPFEIRALKITGYSLYALVVVLIIGSIINIIIAYKPETTIWGVVISLVSIIVMLAVVYGKSFVGKRLNSAAIMADMQCTKICIYMSLILLLSSAVYEFTGFIYADSIGTLGLAWFALREGNDCFAHARGEDHCSHSC